MFLLVREGGEWMLAIHLRPASIGREAHFFAANVIRGLRGENAAASVVRHKLHRLLHEVAMMTRVQSETQSLRGWYA